MILSRTYLKNATNVHKEVDVFHFGCVPSRASVVPSLLSGDKAGMKDSQCRYRAENDQI